MYITEVAACYNNIHAGWTVAMDSGTQQFIIFPFPFSSLSQPLLLNLLPISIHSTMTFVRLPHWEEAARAFFIRSAFLCPRALHACAPGRQAWQ